MSRIAFRADASTGLGHGHVMRCLALADTLAMRGAEVRFLCRSLPGDASAGIRAAGHALTRIGGDAPGPLGTAADAEHTCGALASEAPWDWVVVDHYGLDAGWERALRSVARRVMVIADVPALAHDCDLLLDQNLVAGAEQQWRALCNAEVRLLLGPRHALLRPEFSRARRARRGAHTFASDLLLCFGASDPTHATLQVLRALRDEGVTDLRMTVVAGPANQDLAALRRVAEAFPHLTLLAATSEMGLLLARSRWALLAGGVQLLEALCVGTACMVWPQVDNQRHAVAELVAQGMCHDLHTDLAAGRSMGYAIAARVADLAEAERLSRVGAAFVDGEGAGRVADLLLDSEAPLAGSAP